jgi:hypothetical protein
MWRHFPGSTDITRWIGAFSDREERGTKRRESGERDQERRKNADKEKGEKEGRALSLPFPYSFSFSHVFFVRLKLPETTASFSSSFSCSFLGGLSSLPLLLCAPAD